MLAVVLICVALSAAFALLFILEIAPGRDQLVAQRLSELEESGRTTPAILQRRKRQQRTDRLKAVLQAFGEAVQDRNSNLSGVRQRLVRAGYPNASAVPMYLGARIALPAALAIGAMILLPILGRGPLMTTLVTIYVGATGYVLPSLIVGQRIKRRQKEMQKALPDALDMLV